MHAFLSLPALVFSFFLIFLSVPNVLALSGTQDTDGDGLTDAAEDANGTNVIDGGETNPFNADTDRGGESDGSEVVGRRNPLDPTDDMTYDLDGDGWVNGIEAAEKTDPRNPDSDGDGVKDSLDAFPLDSKYQIDANSNKLPDVWEALNGLATSQATPTRVEDPDGDGLTNAEELARGTHPLQTDTDRDGVDDKTELEESGNPSENACLSYGEATSNFSDIKNHWAEKFVGHLSRTLTAPHSIPILRGYAGDANTQVPFHPDRAITRYEFLKMVMLSTCAKIRANSKGATQTFTDVRSDAPINENSETAFKRTVIYSALHYGFIAGYEDGSFQPDSPVNRGEALKILSLAAAVEEGVLGTPLSFSDVSSNDWFAPYVVLASSREIVMGYQDGTFKPGNNITRAEAAKIVYLTMMGNPRINGYVLPTEEE